MARTRSFFLERTRMVSRYISPDSCRFTLKHLFKICFRGQTVVVSTDSIRTTVLLFISSSISSIARNATLPIIKNARNAQRIRIHSCFFDVGFLPFIIALQKTFYSILSCCLVMSFSESRMPGAGILIFRYPLVSSKRVAKSSYAATSF